MANASAEQKNTRTRTKTKSSQVKKSKKIKRIIVLDSSMILHDWSCVFNYRSDLVVIPFTVIEECDRNKHHRASKKSYNARQFSRLLKKLSCRNLFNGGVSLGERKGRVSVKTSDGLHEDILRIFSNPHKADNRILDVAYRLTLENKNKNKKVIFVSNDINSCLKADALGILNDFMDLNTRKRNSRINKNQADWGRIISD